MELDSLFFSTMNFFGTGGHLFPRTPINNGYIVCAHAHTVASCVDGNVPTADYGKVLANLNRLAESKINQEVHPGPDTLEVFSHYA